MKCQSAGRITRVRHSRVRFAAACVVLTGLLAGCGAIQGIPLPGELDVRKLEIGTYAVDRFKYDVDNKDNGPILEAARMADAVVPSYEIDPSLTHGREVHVITTPDEAIGLVADVSKPVLENRKMIAAYAATGGDQAAKPGETGPSPDATLISNVLFRFPDESSAKLAARELEDVDLAVSADNRKLPSTKFPDAYIHWRPGVASIGAFMAHKEFVISLLVVRPTADSADLSSWVDRTLTAQVPQIDKFTPTPTDQISTLKVDPDNLLSRVTVTDRGGHKPDPADFMIYGRTHMVHLAVNQPSYRKLLEDTGADRFAFVDTGFVARARDEAAAPQLLTGFHDAESDHYDPIEAPKDVPGAKCVVLNDKGDPKTEYKFRCYVSYKRYVAGVSSDREPDVRQRVAAQYALLANSF